MKGLEWRRIREYPNYFVSNKGDVYSLGFTAAKSRILRPAKLKIGYLAVVLWRDGKKRTSYIHKLVAEAFLPKRECRQVANHIDGDKLNNCFENLEWVSYSGNISHAYYHGLRNKRAKITGKEYTTIDRLFFEENMTPKEIAIIYNVSDTTVRDVLKRKLKGNPFQSPRYIELIRNRILVRRQNERLSKLRSKN